MARMAKGCRIKNWREVLPEKYHKQIEEQLKEYEQKDIKNRDNIGRCKTTISEQNEQITLGSKETDKGLLANSNIPCTITIERGSARTLDGDNFIAGCKGLRDSITRLFQRKGDSEKDGMYWQYNQNKCKGGCYTKITMEFEIEDLFI